MMSQWPRIAVERAAANQPRCLFVGSRFPLICVGHVQRALLELQFDNSKLWTIIQSNQQGTAPAQAFNPSDARARIVEKYTLQDAQKRLAAMAENMGKAPKAVANNDVPWEIFGYIFGAFVLVLGVTIAVVLGLLLLL